MTASTTARDGGTWITVCTTCKREGWREGEAETSGERLAALVEAAVERAAGTATTDGGVAGVGPAGDGAGSVRVRRHACLMGCSHACNAAVQGAGKMAYTLGRLAPEPEAADALAAWAALHAASGTGVVAYRSWPAPIKGHFVTRHPPLPEGT